MFQDSSEDSSKRPVDDFEIDRVDDRVVKTLGMRVRIRGLGEENSLTSRLMALRF